MLDVWWRLNTFAQLLQLALLNCCSQHSLFIVWNSNNERYGSIVEMGRIYFPIILVVKICVPNSCLLFFLIQRTEGYRFQEIVGLYLNAYKQIIVCICRFIEWKVYKFSRCNYWLSTTHSIVVLGRGHHSIICCAVRIVRNAWEGDCCLPSCWSAGGGLFVCEESSVNMHWGFYVQCV